MPVATSHCVALQGAIGHMIDVQVDVSPGVVVTSLVGRPDASINEAKDRIRPALTNSGFQWPTTRRVTILPSPAYLPTPCTQFALPHAASDLAPPHKNTTWSQDLMGEVRIGEHT